MSPFRLGRRNESKLNKDAEPSRSPPEESPWQIPPENEFNSRKQSKYRPDDYPPNFEYQGYYHYAAIPAIEWFTRLYIEPVLKPPSYGRVSLPRIKFPYCPTPLYYPEFYESVLESARSEWQKNGIKLHPFEVARMIPQDGRIDLAYNLWWRQILDGLRWQTRKPTREGSLQAEAVDTSTDTNTLRQQFMAKEGKEEVRRLSCFLVDFLKHGEFGVWDFSPRILHSPDENTSRYVSYVKHIIVATSYSSFEGHVYGITQPKNKGDLYPFWHPLKDCPNDTFPTSRGTAAWNRVILLEGLKDVATTSTPVDFVLPPWDFSEDLVAKAIQRHLESKRRGGSRVTNPYTEGNYQIRPPFHITFYEKLTDVNIFLNGKKHSFMATNKENRRIGTLYERQDTGSTASRAHSTSDDTKQDLNARAFRHSAVTILTVQRQTVPEISETGDDTISSSDCSQSMKNYWTTLVLTPTGFKYNRSFYRMLPFDDASLAELYIIVDCLMIVESRWETLQRYFDGLLDEDFMDSEAYTRLIFDDDKLSRSRLYFWTISCLNEFIMSLDDTQKQWKFFCEARIDPDWSTEAASKDKAPGWEEKFEIAQKLLKKGERVLQGLEDIQAEFRAKIGVVQTLRDGLFNASALIESRSSTRLGQNVQLLTYISIFYLPLGFCAALWAVPNIEDSKTRIPFAITTSLVCLITFAVVFNLNNIANALGKTYFNRRQRLVDEMKDDPNSEWHERRQWFEEFPPISDRKSHSE